MAQLYVIEKELQSIKSLYLGSKFGPEKMMSMEVSIPNEDDYSYLCSFINELTPMMRRQGQSNTSNFWMDSFDHEAMF